MANTDTMNGEMKQLKGKMKAAWGKLTDDDMMLYSGKRDQFLGKLQEYYGLAKEDAEKKVKAMEDASGQDKPMTGAMPPKNTGMNSHASK